MEDFSTRTYGTSGLDNRPLFGETSAKLSVLLCLPLLGNIERSIAGEKKHISWIFELWCIGNQCLILLWQKDRIVNLVVGSLTSLLILVTLISAFVFPHVPPKPLNIFFAVCISLSSITACILIYWYRQGDLEPKFRKLIYYIIFSIIMLCICANLYFHDVGR
ncbi:transmembrane protein 243 isoform X2 [Nycticebus coucang]|uniref:transmembrane protein 243 isoform X2 n=1 Tax=Nycticebus coucang TaxID=9470 RepID=UPI00234C9DEF|nr:transmembrane protein 243 isoform X2 [Nycticebus coucang]